MKTWYNSSMVNRTLAARKTSAPISTERSWLGKCASFCHARRRVVLAAWVGTLIAITVLGVAFGSRFQSNFASGNSPSQRAQNLLAARFPSTAGTSADVVIHTSGPVGSASSRATTLRMEAALRALPRVSGVIGPFDSSGSGQILRPRRPHRVRGPCTSTSPCPRSPTPPSTTSSRRPSPSAAPGYEVALGGPAISQVIGAKPGPSEGIGIMAAIIIMLLAFGSVVAMGLPIIIALLHRVAFAVLDLLTHVVTTPVFAPEMMAMIGSGGHRLRPVHRHPLPPGLAEGRNPRKAAAVSLATSGRAVVFAGTTVILSLLGSSCHPVVHAGAGHRGHRRRGRWSCWPPPRCFRPCSGSPDGPSTSWRSSACCRAARSPISGASGTGGVAASSVDPFRSWGRPSSCARLPRHPHVLDAPGLHRRRNDPASTTTRQAFDALADGFGPGFNGPLIVVAQVPAGQQSARRGTRRADAHDPGGGVREPGRVQRVGHAALIVAYPTTAPQSSQTEALVHALRDEAIPARRRDRGPGLRRGDGGVGGRLQLPVQSAAVGDRRRAPAVVPAADGRVPSVAIPVKAVIVNLLSVAPPTA